MFRYILVDDEPLIRKGTIKKLESIKDQVQCVGEAADGEEGLKLVEQENPDLVITDMNMPNMGGEVFLSELHRQYPNIPIIVISGYKDFDYAKQAIAVNASSYILKPFSKNDICDAVLKTVETLKNSIQTKEQLIVLEESQDYIKYDYDLHMLKSLILGYQPCVESFSSDRLKQFMNTPYIVLITLYSDKLINPISVDQYIRENDISDSVLYLPHLHNPNIGILLLLFKEDHPAHLEKYIRQIYTTIRQFFADEEITLSLGISSTKTSTSELHSAYKESLQALNTCTMTDKETIYYYKKSIDPPTQINWPLTEEFLFRLEASESNLIPGLMDQLFLYIKDIEGLTLEDMKYYSLYLIQQVRLILSNYIHINLAGQSNNIENILESIFSFFELQAYLTTLFINISKALENSTVYASEDLIGKIQTYVNRNYFNELNLEFISSLFYINRSYLSHLYKEKTGENFIDYVTKIRIEKAKELLKDTDKKMYQISKAVGYDNIKYFFRVFKKMTKLTPEEYRMKYSS